VCEEQSLATGNCPAILATLQTNFLILIHYYAPPLIGEGIKRWWCLSVCLSYVCLLRTSGLSWEPRPRKTKNCHRYIAHVIRDSETTFKVKGHQAALLTAGLGPRLRCGLHCRRSRLGGARRFGALQRVEGRGHIVAAARLRLVKNMLLIAYFIVVILLREDGFFFI